MWYSMRHHLFSVDDEGAMGGAPRDVTCHLPFAVCLTCLNALVVN